MSKDPFKKIKIGDFASVEKKITKEDVEIFAQLTGDFNALHMDDEFARKTQFSQRIVHGFLHASLLSTLIGMKLPGQGALYLSQEINFVNPVYIGDTVKVTGIVEKIYPSTRILEIRTEGINQQGIKVLTGRAKVRVLKFSEWSDNNQQKEATNMRDLLKGKVALVTGASRGIGKAIAKTLSFNGAFVWINYNKSEKSANELKTEILESGGVCETVRADVTSQKDVDIMTKKIMEQGRLDILVNNAGPSIKSALFENISYEDMIFAFENIVGNVFKVTKAVLPLLKESKGKIINILSSSALGRTAYNWLPYVTAKSALIGFSKNLAQELGPSGIRVNMVSPSMVETDLVSGIPEKYKHMMIAQTPLRRLATVNDVANAVLFLASDLSDFITGDNILVTGGQIML
jgi:3-oxoacyl-[acyl-carrier protein] reductase